MKCIFFGNTGTGRTTLACTYPKPLLLIRPEEVEDGSRTVRHLKGVDITPPMVEDEQLLEIIDLQERKQPYKTIVLDHVPMYQDLIIKRVLGLQEAPIQLTYAMMSRSDWGTVATELKERLRALLRLARLKTDIVMTGGERSVGGGNEDSEIALIAPKMMMSLVPSAIGWLNPACNLIANTYKGDVTEVTYKMKGGKKIKSEKTETRFCLRVGIDSTWTTKVSRPRGLELPPLPEFIVDPTYDKLMALFQGE